MLEAIRGCCQFSTALVDEWRESARVAEHHNESSFPKHGAQSMAEKTKIHLKDSRANPTVLKLNEDHKMPQEGEAVELRGKFRKWRKNRHGEIDGMVLGHGVMIRFPVETGRKVKGKIHRDDDVMVIGVYRNSSKGELQVKAGYLECLKAKLASDIDSEICVGEPQHSVNDPSSCEDLSTSKPLKHANPDLRELVRLLSLLESQSVKDRAERRSQYETLVKELMSIRKLIESK